MAKRITVDPGIYFGKPCVEGTRIPADEVLGLLEDGLSFQDIIRNCYPGLTEEDIRACIHFAREASRWEEVVFTGS